MTVKEVLRKYTDAPLVGRIAVGIVLGLLFALTIPTVEALSGVGAFIALLGSVFVSALKAVAPILVFFLVISALANAKTAGSMKMVVALYIVGTLVASGIAVGASYLFPLDITLVTDPNVEQSSPEGVDAVLTTLVMNLVANPVQALAAGNFMGILAWGIMIGIALRMANENVKDVFSSISSAVTTVVRWVINLAPFGIMGLVYTAVSTNGIEIFVEYGQLILLLVSVMLFIALVTNPILVFACTRKNPYPLVLRTLRDSGLTAFFTRSSAANIPVNMELCSKLGLDKDNYSVSIPLGATVNMSGAAITIAVMAMAACHTLGISVDPVTALILCVLSAVSACGASGVAGGSLLLIPLACSLFGISPDVSMQVVGIGFIIGVIQDSCETALNSSSDVLFAATADYAKQIKEGKEVHMGKDVAAQ